uniref:G_PROTEIN_RECEP_F1_2 domain-containing protein n=1 Tax=Caenorhabditis japonica TaxID=281687 RepID=A0A8R1HH31_CAEJA
MQTSTSEYDRATLMFPSSDPSIRMTLNAILLAFRSWAMSSLSVQFYASVFGVIITSGHLIVLTRKAMRTSSIVPIMMGIAIGDLLAMIATIVADGFMFGVEGTDCTPPVPILSFRIFWLFIVLRDMSRRSSTWLGVILALFRFIMVKFAARPEIYSVSRVNFGFKAVIWSFAVSAVFSMAYYFRYDVIEEGTWRPMQNCTNIPLDTQRPIVTQKPSALFTINNGLFGKTYMFVNGICSKILPCLLLPLLTILLISVLRQADVERKLTNVGPRKATERTTGLVIFMTVTFFIVELPLGLSLVGQVAYTDLGYLQLTTYVQLVVNSVFVLNATIHCLICFLMSSGYRTTVVKMLPCLEKDVMMVQA